MVRPRNMKPALVQNLTWTSIKELHKYKEILKYDMTMLQIEDYSIKSKYHDIQ